jgi:chemotaxis protein MotC
LAATEASGAPEAVPVAVAVPAPRELPPAPSATAAPPAPSVAPAPPAAGSALPADAVAAPLALVPTVAPALAPAPTSASTPRPVRVRTPLPAARAAAAVGAMAAAAAGANAVAEEAAPAAAAAAIATVDDLAAEAEALRTTAEQERAAVTRPQALPRPAERSAAPAAVAAGEPDEAGDAVVAVADGAAAEAVPAEAVAEAVVAEAVVAEAVSDESAPSHEADAVPESAAPPHAAEAGHGAPATPDVAHATPEGTAADAAAAAAGPAPDHAVAPAHDDPAAPPAEAVDATAEPAAEAHASNPAAAPPAAAAGHEGAGPDQAPADAPHGTEPVAAGDATVDAAAAEERPGGVRWIRGAGLPPPAPVETFVAADPAAPHGDAPAGGHAPAADGAAASEAERSRPRRPAGEAIAAPYQLVRTLQAMQDDMAAGSTAALAAQRALLQRMEEEFANADPLVWQDRRNARALVTYTLGGGRPATLRRLLKSETPPDGDEALMRGALAYVEGDEATARRYLAGIDARTLPASLGGQLAVAQAALVVGEDPKRAMALLDTARLLAPGTLVEEAALRRQIFVASELADLDRFEALSGQYLRRFRRSVYAGNFRRRFAAALTRMTFLDDPAQFQRLDDMLAETDPEARRELYLVVAQAAVNAGKTTLAATAAERALSSAPPGSLDETRGRLYRGAALAVTREGFEAAMADLRAIERRNLPRTDAALLQAASETAMLIETAAAGLLPETVAAPGTESGETDTPSPTVTKARAALAAVDALLEQAQ